jgi:hypothetical protein
MATTVLKTNILVSFQLLHRFLWNDCLYRFGTKADRTIPDEAKLSKPHYNGRVGHTTMPAKDMVAA